MLLPCYAGGLSGICLYACVFSHRNTYYSQGNAGSGIASGALATVRTGATVATSPQAQVKVLCMWQGSMCAKAVCLTDVFTVQSTSDALAQCS